MDEMKVWKVFEFVVSTAVIWWIYSRWGKEDAWILVALVIYGLIKYAAGFISGRYEKK